MSYGVRTAYRLVIEGLPLEAVTDPEMERLAPDAYRQRVVGLLREGLRISEECDPAYAEIQAAGMTVQIVDRQIDEIWCRYLCRQPSRRTWLAADLDDTSTTITVSSTEGFSVDEVLHVGTEACLIDSIDSSTQMTIQRGSLDTIPQFHYVSFGDRTLLPVVTLTHPIGLEGRRAYLYRYTDEDALQGDGTLIGRFIVATDSRLEDDGGTWSLQLDSIVNLLKQPMSSDTEDPITIRGAYYPPGYGIFKLHEMVSYLLVDTNRRAEWRIWGHFETQEDFCAAMQACIRAAMDPTTGDLALIDISAWESTGFGGALIHDCFNSASYTDRESVFVLPTSGGWQVVWTADPVNPAHLVLGLEGDASVIDGGTRVRSLGDILEPDYIPLGGLPPSPAGGTFAQTTLRGGMPRAVWGNRNRYYGTDPDPNLSVWDLFLSTTSSAFAGVDIEFKDGGDPSGYGFGATADATLGRIRVEPAGEITGVRASYPGRDVVIKARRLIARGNLADFRDGLTALGPELANAGAMPFVTTEDLADWRTVVEQAAAGRPFTTRVYKTAGEVELDELLKHDCRLLGVYPVLDAAGKIALKPLRIPTASAVAAFEIDASNTLVDDQPPGWERNAVYGSINVVKLRTFYDVIEEEHTGQTYVIPDVTAQSVRKSPKELEIAPLSSESIRDSRVWTADLAVEVARTVLSIFGRPYSIVKVRVPYTLLTTALCGTVGRITSHRLPDPVTGERGLDQKAGLVIGRDWDLATEQGTLTMLVADAPLAGYAPSVFVTGNTLVSGTTYDLAVTFNDPSGSSMAPAGAVLSDLYDVGFRLELIEWDSTSQTPQACVIDAIDDDASELRVTFSAAPTFTGTRYLRLRSYDSSSLPETQRRFAHFADGDNQLDRGTEFEPAREYAG